LIAGESLIEFKSTAGDRPIDSVAIFQLVSYPCLDYADEYRIRRVGLSLLRRNYLKEWPLDDLIGTLSGGTTTYDSLRAVVRQFFKASSDPCPGMPDPSAGRTAWKTSRWLTFAG
jgi:hypothetical protein